MTMKIVVAAALIAASITAPETAHAGLTYCHKMERRYSYDPTTKVPMECMDSKWMPGC